MNTANTKPKPKSKLGIRVRVLSGAATGKVGVIAGVDAGATTYYRVLFEPPVYLPTVGHVTSVWRQVIDLEEIGAGGDTTQSR